MYTWLLPEVVEYSSGDRILQLDGPDDDQSEFPMPLPQLAPGGGQFAYALISDEAPDEAKDQRMGRYTQGMSYLPSVITATFRIETIEVYSIA